MIVVVHKNSMMKIACAFVKMEAIRDIIALIPAQRQREVFGEFQNLPVKRAIILFGRVATVTVVDLRRIFLLIRRRRRKRV